MKRIVAALGLISLPVLAEPAPAYVAIRDVTIHVETENDSSACDWLTNVASAMIIQDFEGSTFPKVECQEDSYQSRHFTLKAKFGSYALWDSESGQKSVTADWIPFDHVYGKETYDCPQRSAIVRALLTQGFDTRNLVIEDRCETEGSVRAYGDRLGPYHGVR